MNKNHKKNTQYKAHHWLFLLAVVCFLTLISIGNVSAVEWDNVKSYDVEKQEVSIANSILWLFKTGEISRIKLLTPLDNHVGAGYQMVAELEFDNKGDYTNVFKAMEFYDVKNGMSPIEREFDYKVRVEKTREVIDYETICEKVLDKNSTNGTYYDSCSQVEIGSHQEDYYDWELIDEKSELKAGVYRIGIFTDVKVGDKVEWIPTLYGVRIEEWATWTADLNTGLEFYHKLDETSGNPIDSLGIYNGTNYDGVTQGVSGIQGTAYDYDGTNDYTTINGWIMPYNSESTINFWVNASSSNGDLDYIFSNAGTGNGGIEILFYSPVCAGNKLMLQIWDDGDSDNLCSTGDVKDDEWHMITFNFNDTDGYTFYVDGVINAQGTQDMNTPILNISLMSQAGSNFAKGVIDELSAWNRTLTTDEITQLYNSGDGITYPTSLSAVALISPEDNFMINSAVDDFEFNFTLTDLDWNNYTFYVWDSADAEERKRVIVNGTGDADCSQTVSGDTVSVECIGQDINTEDTYEWNVELCTDDDACVFATSNYTFTIDTTPPDVTIISPTDTITYGYENLSQVLNWSINDTNLDSIWFEYNGVNTTIYGADNSTTFNLSDYDTRTLTIYVNDSAGNEGSETISWDYDVYLNSETYTSPAYSTQLTPFIVNLTFDTTKYNSIYANLIYDGTSYAGTSSGSGSNYIFTRNLYAEDVAVATDKPFYWNIQLVNASGSTYQNTTLTNQTINPLTEIVVSGSACGAGLNTSMMFSFYDEENLSAMNVNVDYNFQFGLSQENSDFSFGNNVSTNVLYICINTTDIDSYYLNYGELDYQADGWSERRYYTFTNRTLTATQSNISIYSLISGSSSSFLMEVVDTKLSPYENVYLSLSRWYPSLNEYRVVEMAQTDEKGETVFKTKVEDVDYRIGVYYANGTLIHLTDPLRFVCLSSPCSYTITVPSTSANDFRVFNDLSYSLTFNSTSKVFSFIFSDPSQTTESFTLQAYKQTGSSELIVCNETVTGWTGVITCDVSAYSGTIIAYALRTTPPQTTIASLIETIRSTALTQDIGLFISLFVVMALVLIGLVSPILTILLAIIGLIPAMIFGIMPLGIILVLTTMAFIVIHFMKKSRSAV